MERLTSFNQLKDGDRIISPIDNEVTEFMVDEDGDFYLAGKISAFPAYQFDQADFYIYYGGKNVGEIDKDYLK